MGRLANLWYTPPMKIYRTPNEYRIVLLPFILVFISFGLFAVGQAFGKIAEVIALFCIALVWYKYLITTHTVEISDEKDISLRSYLSTIVVPGENIERLLDYNFILLVVHTNGRNSLVSLINNFKALKDQLRNINPNIQHVNYNERIEKEQNILTLYVKMILQFLIYR